MDTRGLLRVRPERHPTSIDDLDPRRVVPKMLAEHRIHGQAGVHKHHFKVEHSVSEMGDPSG